jgi:plastocyanin
VITHRVLGAFIAGALLCSFDLVFAAEGLTVVAQKGRSFGLEQVDLQRGGIVRFTNEDDYLHQLYIHSPKMTFDSQEQSPGTIVDVRFIASGDFTVLCGIHPRMRMSVHVAE